MVVKEKPYYYDMSKILSMQRGVNFIVGGRELGKTYAAKKHILRKLLEHPDRKMIYMVRFKDDKKMLKDLFADVIKEPQFKDVTYKVNTGSASNIIINGVDRGRIVAVTEVQRFKRTTGTNYFYLLFDEFLVQKGGRYAPNEVENVLNIMQTVLRDKGDVAHEAKTFFLANSTSLFNPYFESLGLKPNPTKVYNLYPDAVIEICNPDDYAVREYSESDVHNFFKRHKAYSAMSFTNDFEDNQTTLIRKRSKHDIPLYTFKIDGEFMGIWYDPKFDEILFSSKIEPNIKERFSIKLDEQADDVAYNAWYSTKMLSRLQKARDQNNILFEDARVKSKATALLRYLKIY